MKYKTSAKPGNNDTLRGTRRQHGRPGLMEEKERLKGEKKNGPAGEIKGYTR